MPRKKQYQYDVSVTGGSPERLSRSRKKRDSAALQELGQELAALPIRELAKLDLSPDLLEACRALTRITAREAKRRQMQYIGRLMREEDDIERLRLAVEHFKDGRLPSEAAGGNAGGQAQQHGLEA